MKLVRVALCFLTKARVCQWLFTIPNAVYPLVSTLSRQVWSHSQHVRAVGGSEVCTLKIIEI